MYILHIETSTPVCSIALSHGHDLIGFEDLDQGMNHTAILTPAIQRLLRNAAVDINDLAAISVCSGPGSYTGLRVGSATAKAMAYSLEKPVIAIPTLLALASAAFAAYPEVSFALPMLDARRKEVYTSLYNQSLEPVWPLSSLILEEEFFRDSLLSFPSVVTCGDGAAKIGDLRFLSPNLVVDDQIRCSARHLVSLAVDRFEKGEFEDPLHFVPFYLKPPNITKAREKKFQ